MFFSSFDEGAADDDETSSLYFGNSLYYGKKEVVSAVSYNYVTVADLDDFDACWKNSCDDDFDDGNDNTIVDNNDNDNINEYNDDDDDDDHRSRLLLLRSSSSSKKIRRIHTDYYTILNLPASDETSSNEIELNFKHLARVYHPDTLSRNFSNMVSSSKETFASIKTAAVVLLDPVVRLVYDTTGTLGVEVLTIRSQTRVRSSKRRRNENNSTSNEFDQDSSRNIHSSESDDDDDDEEDLNLYKLIHQYLVVRNDKNTAIKKIRAAVLDYQLRIPENRIRNYRRYITSMNNEAKGFLSTICEVPLEFNLDRNIVQRQIRTYEYTSMTSQSSLSKTSLSIQTHYPQLLSSSSSSSSTNAVRSTVTAAGSIFVNTAMNSDGTIHAMSTGLSLNIQPSPRSNVGTSIDIPLPLLRSPPTSRPIRTWWDLYRLPQLTIRTSRQLINGTVLECALRGTVNDPKGWMTSIVSKRNLVWSSQSTSLTAGRVADSPTIINVRHDVTISPFHGHLVSLSTCLQGNGVGMRQQQNQKLSPPTYQWWQFWKMIRHWKVLCSLTSRSLTSQYPIEVSFQIPVHPKPATSTSTSLSSGRGDDGGHYHVSYSLSLPKESQPWMRIKFIREQSWTCYRDLDSIMNTINRTNNNDNNTKDQEYEDDHTTLVRWNIKYGLQYEGLIGSSWIILFHLSNSDNFSIRIPVRILPKLLLGGTGTITNSIPPWPVVSMITYFVVDAVEEYIKRYLAIVGTSIRKTLLKDRTSIAPCNIMTMNNIGIQNDTILFDGYDFFYPFRNRSFYNAIREVAIKKRNWEESNNGLVIMKAYYWSVPMVLVTIPPQPTVENGDHFALSSNSANTSRPTTTTITTYNNNDDTIVYLLQYWVRYSQLIVPFHHHDPRWWTFLRDQNLSEVEVEERQQRQQREQQQQLHCRGPQDPNALQTNCNNIWQKWWKRFQQQIWSLANLKVDTNVVQQQQQQQQSQQQQQQSQSQQQALTIRYKYQSRMYEITFYEFEDEYDRYEQQTITTVLLPNDNATELGPVDIVS